VVLGTLFFVTIGRLAQSQTPLPATLAQLESSDPAIRSEAFYALVQSDSSGDEQVKLAAIKLLTTENSALKKLTGPDEAYGDYYRDVVTFVVSLNDVRALNPLLEAIDTGNMVTKTLAGFGKTAIDPVIGKLNDKNPDIRDSAVIVLEQMLDPENASKVGDPQSLGKIRQGLNRAALDPDDQVKLTAEKGLIKLFRVSIPVPFQSVNIDIKPHHPRNVINLKKKRPIVVAILSSPSFDATTVDSSTVKFGPAQTGQSDGAQVKDVNRDKRPDLVLYFDRQGTGILCTDTASFLTGRTFNGQSIFGVDSIQPVRCGKPGPHENEDDDDNDE
jgi:hypothetical protein